MTVSIRWRQRQRMSSAVPSRWPLVRGGRVGRCAAGPGHVGRQGAQRRAVVGGIGHDMDHPARKRQRKLADQDRGRFHLAGAFAFAAQPARPGAQRGRLRSRSRESPACWTPCSTPASRRSKPRRLSWRNVIKQADGRDTRDCIDASHPRVWRPAADGAPVLDQADRPQNWLIGARRPANLATCRPAPDSAFGARHKAAASVDWSLFVTTAAPG